MTKPADLNYYEADNVYGALFFQFPKALIHGEQYEHLSSDVKLAYMVLKDRLEYSLRNHWADGEGHVYLIFTDQELENSSNYHNQKVVKLKKELEIAHLLIQKRMGSNPRTKKNEPSRLHLSELDVKATDVHLCGEYAQKESQTLATNGNVRITLPREIARTPATSGNVKTILLHKSVDETGQTLATSGNVKIVHNLDKEQVLDINRHNTGTQELGSSTTNFSPTEIEQQSHDLVKHANDSLTDKGSGLPVFLEPEAVQLLSSWCRTPQQMRCSIGTILNAEYKVERDHRDIGVRIPLDDKELKPLMTKTLGRYFNALGSNEKHIKDAENYLYGTMQSLFGIWWSKQTAREYAVKHPKRQNADSENFWDPNVFRKWHRSFLNDQTKPRS